MKRTPVLVAGTAAVLAAAAVAVLLLSRSETSAGLDEIRTLPMAGYVPPAATLIREDVSDAQDSTLLGKPQLARLDRLFALDGSAESAFGEAVRTAHAAGWDVDPNDDDFVETGTKRLPSGAEVTITIDALTDPLTRPEDVSGPVLFIGLTHQGTR